MKPPDLPLAGRLRPVVVSRRPHRRAHRVGGARARSARLRLDRRRVAGHRTVRRPAGAGPLRRVRQLAAPDRRADVGHSGAFSSGGRRPDDGRAGRGPGVHRGARPDDGSAGGRSRPAASRVPRQLHLRAGAQGVHHRPRPDHRDRPGAQVARDREGGGRLLRTAVGGHHRSSATRTAERCSSAPRRWRSCSDCADSPQSSLGHSLP